MRDHNRCIRVGRRALRILPVTVTVPLALMAALAPAIAASPADFAAIALPTSFIGEAATLALAFAAPALCAGGYLVLKRMASAIGTTAVVGMGLLTMAGGIALALGTDVQALTKLAGL
jgi:hypothetical protein